MKPDDERFLWHRNRFDACSGWRENRCMDVNWNADGRLFSFIYMMMMIYDDDDIYKQSLAWISDQGFHPCNLRLFAG